MPLSSIVLIVVRLFALSWLLQALALIASAIAVPLPYRHYMSATLIHYGPAVFLAILAIFLWILAPAVARFVSGGFDASVNMGSLSRSDLYSFAFVFLGLFFILSSFADVINWIHYFAVAPEDLRHDPRIQNFYKLTRPCLTLAAGLVSLIGAPRWTRKLISHDRRSELA
jgi:hypothetical protein